MIHSLYYYVVSISNNHKEFSNIREADFRFQKDGLVEAWVKGQILLFFNEEAERIIQEWEKEQKKIKEYTT